MIVDNLANAIDYYKFHPLLAEASEIIVQSEINLTVTKTTEIDENRLKARQLYSLFAARDAYSPDKQRRDQLYYYMCSDNLTTFLI